MTIRGSFILIPLQAGSHTISARFVPQGFAGGLLVSLASLAAVLAVVLVTRIRKRYGI
jgi:uncharacterized membrane protein YfhO